MSDLISRAAALDAIDFERKVLIEQGRLGAEHIVVHHARRLIEELPGVNAAPVKHGHWIFKRRSWAECSECHHDYNDAYDVEHADNYCRFCGAIMDGEGEAT